MRWRSPRGERPSRTTAHRPTAIFSISSTATSRCFPGKPALGQAGDADREPVSSVSARAWRGGAHVQPDAPRRARFRSGAGRLRRRSRGPFPRNCATSASKWSRCAGRAATRCRRRRVRKRWRSSIRPRFTPRCARPSRNGSPRIAQLEFTQMAQYAPDCAPARTILVEHDITYDLYAQMLAQVSRIGRRAASTNAGSRFEREAWSTVDRVVVMSEQRTAR